MPLLEQIFTNLPFVVHIYTVGQFIYMSMLILAGARAQQLHPL
jgi:ABC-type Mn2+/Zn2+ transport system permease subunit